jgi:hypothetical protein
VDAQLLRLFFNTIDVVGQVAAQTLRAVVIRDKEVPLERCIAYGFPTGTRSQLVSYRSGSEELAKAHRYVFPDGRLGGSGKPDPKLIVCCGVTLYQQLPDL